jgi:hypothetical protein
MDNNKELPEIIEENGEFYRVERHTLSDGRTTEIKQLVSEEPKSVPKRQTPPSVEQQILAETQYQTALMEMNMMGGM